MSSKLILTFVIPAFAILNKADMVPAFTDDWAVESGLPKLVNRTHAAGNKVMLSVGGWTGSIKFSSMVAKQESRKKFIDWNLDFISKYSTDGVDIGKKNLKKKVTSDRKQY
jgi:GH18 family chitinase